MTVGTVNSPPPQSFRQEVADTGKKLTETLVKLDFVSKVASVAKEIFGMIGELAISESTRETAMSVHGGLNDATKIMALPKPIIVIPGAYNDVKETARAAQVIMDDEGDTKSWLKLGHHSTGFIGKLTVIFGFGVSRWITFLEKYLNTTFGKNAHAIGQAFPILMLINHSTGLLSSGCGVAEMNMRRDVMEEEEISKFRKTISGLFEDAIDLFLDIIRIIALAVHPLIRIPLAIASSFIGVYKIWTTTT